MFEVETGIPLRRKVREKNAGIPFEKLTGPDQSMHIANDVVATKSVKVAAHRYAKEAGVKLSVQVEPGGCRIYRL